MKRRRMVGLALGAGVAAAGAAGYLARRRLLGEHQLGGDEVWEDLHAPLDARTRTVSSPDGTRLHVTVLGEEDAPTLVLAHGYGMATRFWHYQLRALSDEFRVVAYDQRGHAESEPATNDEYNAEVIGTDLLAVLDAVLGDDRQVVLIGHSMGGMSIMSLAMQHPKVIRERVAGVALVSTAASRTILGSAFSTGINRLARIEEALGRRVLGTRVPLSAQTNDLSFLVTRGVALGPEAHDAHIAFTEQLYVEVPVEVRAAFGQMLGTMHLEDGLEALDVPALVLVGSRDRLTPPRQSRAIVGALPDPTFVELEGVGHMAPLEAHEEVTALLRQHARAAFSAASGGRRATG